MTALPMTKPLPPVFAVYGVEDRWFLIAPSRRPHDRTSDRRELRAVDLRALASELVRESLFASETPAPIPVSLCEILRLPA